MVNVARQAYNAIKDTRTKFGKSFCICLVGALSLTSCEEQAENIEFPGAIITLKNSCKERGTYLVKDDNTYSKKVKDNKVKITTPNYYTIRFINAQETSDPDIWTIDCNVPTIVGQDKKYIGNEIDQTIVVPTDTISNCLKFEVENGNENERIKISQVGIHGAYNTIKTDGTPRDEDEFKIQENSKDCHIVSKGNVKIQIGIEKYNNGKLVDNGYAICTINTKPGKSYTIKVGVDKNGNYYAIL